MSKVRLTGKQFLRWRLKSDSFLGSPLRMRQVQGEGSRPEQREEACCRANPGEALTGPRELRCWDSSANLCRPGQRSLRTPSRTWPCTLSWGSVRILCWASSPIEAQFLERKSAESAVSSTPAPVQGNVGSEPVEDLG